MGKSVGAMVGEQTSRGPDLTKHSSIYDEIVNDCIDVRGKQRDS